MVPFPQLAAQVVAAPMAGVSTPDLVARVNAAGGLGFLAAGYLTPARLAHDIRATRDRTDAPFGVNLFVPGPARSPVQRHHGARAVAQYAALLAPQAQKLGVCLPEPDWQDTDHWDAKLTLLADIDPVAVVSFTFGVPPRPAVDRLHAAGSCVAVTVTNRPEARTAGDTRRALAAGAVAVAVGTALLLTDEAGTSAAYRMGLTDPALGSMITRAFSGRPARGLRNRFAVEHRDHAPPVYPQVDQLTKPMRAAAAAQGDLETVSLWAGSGWRAAREEPAEVVVTRLSN